MKIPTGYQDKTGFHFGIEPAKETGLMNGPSA